MSKDDGGPAFPRITKYHLDKTKFPGHQTLEEWDYEDGMTVLDYFAGQETTSPEQGIMKLICEEMRADGSLPEGTSKSEDLAADTYFKMIARYRFRQAQAMIDEKLRLEK